MIFADIWVPNNSLYFQIQELTDRYTDKIEEMFKAKTAELLKGN